jgi:hypothetical protein
MRNRMTVAIALALLASPAICSAQHAAEWRDSAQRLDAAVHALRDSMLQGDPTAAEVARRGDLVVAASAGQTANALDALSRFESVRNRWYAGEMPARGGFRIVLRTETGARSTSGPDSTGMVILAGLPGNGNAVLTQRTVAGSSVAANLIDRYGEMMVASVPALSAWIENPPPLSADPKERRDEAMYTFVTATGAIERRCVAGGMPACRVAMSIRQIEGTENGGRFSPFMRADLLYYALDLGGAGAWARLRGAADSGVATMLSSAAKLPTDSLLARWRSGLLARRPATAVLSGHAALIAITWSAMLLLGVVGVSKWS